MKWLNQQALSDEMTYLEKRKIRKKATASWESLVKIFTLPESEESTLSRIEKKKFQKTSMVF